MFINTLASNDHLSSAANILGSHCWPLFTILTVNLCVLSSYNTMIQISSTYDIVTKNCACFYFSKYFVMHGNRRKNTQI